MSCTQDLAELVDFGQGIDVQDFVHNVVNKLAG